MAVGDSILAMKRACEEQEVQRVADCPVCAWPIEELEDGTLHCVYCGWTDVLKRTRQYG